MGKIYLLKNAKNFCPGKVCTQTDFHLEMKVHDFLLNKYLQIIAKPVFRFLSSKIRRFTKKKSKQSYSYTGKELDKEKIWPFVHFTQGRYFEAP